MQEKKNIALSISLGVLVLACFLVYHFKRSGGTDVDKTLFRVNDFATIDRVVMTSERGTVELRTDGGRWRVNDTVLADRALIDVLFATLQQAEPKRPVAARLRDSLSTYLDQHGVHVELYSGEELMKAFEAGGNPVKTEAYFKKTGTAAPYIMVIPGYRVYVSGILELTPAGWRDRYVFGFNWMNFRELSASFPGQPEAGFTVRRDNNNISISGLAEPDTARLNSFLDEVSLLTAQEFMERGMDSVRDQIPIMRIIVKDVANREYSLDLYPQVGTNDPYLGLVNGTDPALFDSRTVRNLLRRRDYFTAQ